MQTLGPGLSQWLRPWIQFNSILWEHKHLINTSIYTCALFRGKMGW